MPDPLDVLAFAGGAVSVYILLGLLEFPEIHVVEPIRTRRIVVFHAVPILAAALVFAVDRVVDHPLWGWFLSGATATGAYVALLALVWAWDARHAAPPTGREPPV